MPDRPTYSRRVAMREAFYTLPIGTDFIPLNLDDSFNFACPAAMRAYIDYRAAVCGVSDAEYVRRIIRQDWREDHRRYVRRRGNIERLRARFSAWLQR